MARRIPRIIDGELYRLGVADILTSYRQKGDMKSSNYANVLLGTKQTSIYVFNVPIEPVHHAPNQH